MERKSPDAFRTISEVAEWLDVPTHVLRFWESRFTQVKPVKRAGGRRYYRPADMELLGGIKRLLHDDGLTIRGVQKLLREEGVKHVASLSPSPDGPTSDGAVEQALPEATPMQPPAEENATTEAAPPEHDESPMAVDVPVIPYEGDVVNFVPDTEAAPEITAAAVDETLNRWPFVDDADDAHAVEQSPSTQEIAATESAPDASAGALLAVLVRADPTQIKARAATLRPLVVRMAALRDRMAEAD